MGKIFFLMGKSSSGKDTIYKALLSDKELGLRKVLLYTTRPIREGETDGVEYFFISEDKMKDMESEGCIIEKRTYRTCFGDWHYYTAEDGQIDLAKSDYLIIGTPASFTAMAGHYGEDAVLPIYIELDDGERLERAIQREKRERFPKYEELCRRFLADAIDFSEEVLAKIGVRKRFHNGNLNDCICEISEYIRSEEQKCSK